MYGIPSTRKDKEESFESLYNEIKASQASHCDEMVYERSNGEILILLTNNDRAWLTHLANNEGDTGFSTRNPNFSGSKEDQLSYYFSNGQCSEYPEYWTVPLEEAIKAVQYFLKFGGRSPNLTWHDDSQTDE